MKTLVLVGINNYGPGMGGARLEGCEHDIIGEYRWVHENRFEAGNINLVVLADRDATCSAIKTALIQGVAAAGDNEWVAFKQSSHGAAPGLVCYDSDWNDQERTFLGTQALGEIFSKLKPKSRGFMSIDCCEFGDAMRSSVIFAPLREIANRYIENPNGVDTRTLTSPHAIIPRGISNLVTIAGCVRGGTCADVRDAMGAYGAFSHFEVKERQNRPVSEICAAVNRDLQTNQYEQRSVWTGPDVAWMK